MRYVFFCGYLTTEKRSIIMMTHPLMRGTLKMVPWVAEASSFHLSKLPSSPLAQLPQRTVGGLPFVPTTEGLKYYLAIQTFALSPQVTFYICAELNNRLLCCFYTQTGFR
ncbi:hypothetical protein CDAR_420341 [Caerostris darwini]|uniref:Uncharacterized protein n=1 Tax=Caerostris darwini TaxID=1538125 RepID=A0AAV4TPT7_9ARAC|nr:hypothetical protein CDAR_420341 [Caerostris darwini]